MHSIPDAWNYKFLKLINDGQGCYVIINLIEDEVVYGYLGSNSMASSDVDNRDIYLESVYEVDDVSGNWKEVDGNQGIWISSSIIKYIEFK